MERAQTPAPSPRRPLPCASGRVSYGAGPSPPDVGGRPLARAAEGDGHEAQVQHPQGRGPHRDRRSVPHAGRCRPVRHLHRFRRRVAVRGCRHLPESSSRTPVGSSAPDGKSITFTAPAILSSAPASAPIVFTVKNVGSIPVTLHVTGELSGATARFTAIDGAPVDVGPLAMNADHTYTGGLQWTELVQDDLSRAVSVTYSSSRRAEAPAMMTFHKAGGLAAVAGLSLMLVGGGLLRLLVGQRRVPGVANVGTFACELSSTTPGAVVTGHTVSYTEPAIQSSVIGDVGTLSVDVTAAGSIRSVVHWTVGRIRRSGRPLGRLDGDPVHRPDITLAAGESKHYDDLGFVVSALDNTDLESVQYHHLYRQLCGGPASADQRLGA